jgi:hypothetical protein
MNSQMWREGVADLADQGRARHPDACSPACGGNAASTITIGNHDEFRLAHTPPHVARGRDAQLWEYLERAGELAGYSFLTNSPLIAERPRGLIPGPACVGRDFR